MTNDSYICSICTETYSYKKKRIEVGEQYWLENCCSKECYKLYILSMPEKVLHKFVNPETNEIVEAYL